MFVKKPWSVPQAEHFLNEIASSIETSSSAEIEQDALASGKDLNVLATATRGALMEGIKKFSQRRLHHARERYVENVNRIEARKRRIAGDPDSRRRQFSAVLKSRPELRSTLTIQHRDLDSLTDSDIESALEELDALGALDQFGDTHDDSNS